MTVKTKAARHRCNDNRAKMSTSCKDTHIIAEFNSATLIWGVVFAISIGLMMIHAAVVL